MKLAMRSLSLPLVLALPLLGQGAGKPLKYYERHLQARMVPLLQEVLRFPTVQGDTKARDAQQAWLRKTGTELGLLVRDAGLVTEIELPGPKGAPVLGLVVHGDVQPVDAKAWSIPPFEGAVKDGKVLGRGAADDKGPLVQALLAMKALKETMPKRTYTIRLLMGSDEESDNLDIATYLKEHKAPDLSLVLDSGFPVIVGEKAWNALTVETDLGSRHGKLAPPSSLTSGLAPSIVPDQAAIEMADTLDGQVANSPYWEEARKKLGKDFRLEVRSREGRLAVTVYGRAAHAGVNAEGGRNAITALAKVVLNDLEIGGAADLLAFAQLAGQDLVGTGLGLVQPDPVFGRATVVPTMLQPQPNGKHRLTINIRSTPALSGEALKAHLFAQVAAFNARTGAHLEPGGFFGDTPLSFDPKAKLVRRLQAAYARATGIKAEPAISGGGTYAKRLPHAIAFGMWFPDKPYPGHDVDEQVPVADLHKGVKVLLEALTDLAGSKPLKEPFRP
jgi:succinyl-diaminopimelate desuccinylase